MLEPVRVFAVAAVFRPARGLYVSRLPWPRAERAQRRRRVKGARPHLHVIGLQDDAALIAPIAMEGQDQVLETKAHVAGIPVTKQSGGFGA